MITGWKNINAFKQHMVEMESFRRAHRHMAPSGPLKSMSLIPADQNNHPPCPPGPAVFTDENGNVIVFPIWEIDIPKGAQN
jgi:hypothetical protein